MSGRIVELSCGVEVTQYCGPSYLPEGGRLSLKIGDVELEGAASVIELACTLLSWLRKVGGEISSEITPYDAGEYAKLLRSWTARARAEPNERIEVGDYVAARRAIGTVVAIFDDPSAENGKPARKVLIRLPEHPQSWTIEPAHEVIGTNPPTVAGPISDLELKQLLGEGVS